ncbi:T-cell immunoglobulin and mucin domain-containing protein 4-like [Epinephelus fuscoguttatus]|uniref:T-cell immunoglobulin and mucin domain-containing protein 4-like n=1 Tax=Epinephelus fuscoguttatus TaxID=293821 RepID=UPI0020D183B7|nr:T-cell immunoglobulin and mucin domain-containing protein 4-like [Epinephelus fuscoguttatus]
MSTMKTQSGLMLLLAVLSVSEGDGSRVVGRLDGNVTLPCTCDIKYYGALPVCWGRGEIPNSGCIKQLISTDGQKDTEGSRVSSRFQLLGRLDEGDVSLTILNVSETDAGRYGCRLWVPGPFNDLKYHIDLTIEEAPVTTTPTRQRGSDVTSWIGSDVTGDHTTESMVTLPQEMWSTAVANIVRLSFVIAILPALLLTVAYGVWRRDQRSDSRLNQSEKEEEDEGSSSV